MKSGVNHSTCKEVITGANFTEWFNDSVWMATCNVASSNCKKIIDVKVNKIKHYFISHTKISFKSPKFKTFKAK